MLADEVDAVAAELGLGEDAPKAAKLSHSSSALGESVDGLTADGGHPGSDAGSAAVVAAAAAATGTLATAAGAIASMGSRQGSCTGSALGSHASKGGDAGAPLPGAGGAFVMPSKAGGERSQLPGSRPSTGSSNAPSGAGAIAAPQDGPPGSEPSVAARLVYAADVAATQPGGVASMPPGGGSPRVGSPSMSTARMGSPGGAAARMGSPGIGSQRVGSARTGSKRICSPGAIAARVGSPGMDAVRMSSPAGVDAAAPVSSLSGSVQGSGTPRSSSGGAATARVTAKRRVATKPKGVMLFSKGEESMVKQRDEQVGVLADMRTCGG